MFHVPNECRIRTGRLASNDEHGNNGAFLVAIRNEGQHFCQASDGAGWEHVSVSRMRLPDRCPSWDAMCAVKAIFWDPEDCVMQLHPPEKDYVRLHQGCLHLWRPVSAEIPRPHHFLVGPKKPEEYNHLMEAIYYG